MCIYFENIIQNIDALEIVKGESAESELHLSKEEVLAQVIRNYE